MRQIRSADLVYWTGGMRCECRSRLLLDRQSSNREKPTRTALISLAVGIGGCGLCGGQRNSVRETDTGGAASHAGSASIPFLLSWLNLGLVCPQVVPDQQTCYHFLGAGRVISVAARVPSRPQPLLIPDAAAPSVVGLPQCTQGGAQMCRCNLGHSSSKCSCLDSGSRSAIVVYTVPQLESLVPTNVVLYVITTLVHFLFGSQPSSARGMPFADPAIERFRR
jgi:hypothetical protein